MAYVGDNGKRTAPTRRSRKAKPAPQSKPPTSNAPRNVQTPPRGDIASSGGDYGTRKAKQYQASRAGRKAVRDTYAEQTPKRRQQIAMSTKYLPDPVSTTIQHEHHRAVGAARRAAGLTTPGSVIPGLGQVRQQQRSFALSELINKARADSNTRSTGDTKGNLELASAEAYKSTPEFQNKLYSTYLENSVLPKNVRLTKDISPSEAKSMGTPYQVNAGGGIADVSGYLHAGALANEGLKHLGAPAVARNFAEEAVDLPAQGVPSIYEGLVKPLGQGDPQKALKNITTPYKNLYEDPKKQLTEHPLTSALMIAGPLRGLDRTLGKVGRLTGKIPNYRPDAIVPDTGLAIKRPTARGLVTGTAQTIRDRPIVKGEKPPPLATGRQVRRSAHEDEGRVEEQRRIDRERSAIESNIAVGKKPTVAHVLGVQNIANNMGELRAYRGQLQDFHNQLTAQIKAKDPQLVKGSAKAKTVKDNLDDLNKFLDSKEISARPNHADFPEDIRAEIETYKALSIKQQGKLGKLYAQTDRLNSARLIPYARQRMGASFEPRVKVDTERGHVVSDEMVKEIREEMGVNDKSVPVGEHEARLAAFKDRVKTHSDVLVKDGKVLDANAIHKHMEEAGQPTRAEPAANAEFERTTQALGRLETKFRKAYGFTGKVDPSKLKGVDLKKWDAAREEVATAERAVKTAREGREGLTEPGFVTQSPNLKSAAAHFVNPNRPQAITPSGRTGQATLEGTLPLGKHVLRDTMVRTQGLITAAEQFSNRLARVAVRVNAKVPDVLREEVVHDPDHPEILTIKSARAARQFADDYNTKNPKSPIAPVQLKPFGAGHGQVDELLSRAENDPHLAQMAEKAMSDSLQGYDSGGTGNFAFAPKEYVGEMAKYLGGETMPGRRMFGSQFRKVVLSTSPSWLIGNVAEASIRTAINRVGPTAWLTGIWLEKELKKTDEGKKILDELMIRGAGGGHYGIQRRAAIYSHAGHFDDASSEAVRNIARAVGAMYHSPPGQLVGKAWDGWTDLVFNQVNGRIEAGFQKAMLGKAINEHLMSNRLNKLSKKAMKQALDGVKDVNTIAQLGREVDKMYGKYSKFGPKLKRLISHETPFIAWYLNSLRFIYHSLPKDHPVATATLASAYQSTEEWRKDHGLGIFLHKNLPDFLQGSVPAKGGNWRLQYTPFSAVSDPLGTPASLMFPQYQSILNAGKGKDWKGDDIKGFDENILLGPKVAVLQLLSMMVPGSRQAQSYFLEKKEGESQKERIIRAFGIPHPSKSLQQTKTTSDKKKYFSNPVDSSGQSDTTKKKKYFSSPSSGSGGTKKKKYFSTP